MAALIPSANASGSGTMTLAGPSTNSNQTVTIPDTTGTMMVSGNMPAFSAYQSVGTTANNSTWTKIACNIEEFDTNSYYDNATNYRFTPLIAGYYQVNASVQMSAITASEATIAIYKNGSAYKQGLDIVATTMYQLTVNALVYLNGSTDYIEIYVYQASGASKTIQGNTLANTYFQAAMIRGA